MLVFTLAALASAIVAPPAPCTARTPAAIAYDEASAPKARDAVDAALAAACFTLTEVVGDDEPALLDAARGLPAKWLLVAKATLDEAQGESFLPYTSVPRYALTVDVTAFDVETGRRRGRALRSVNLVSSTPAAAARSREAGRVIADAVRALEAQMREPPAVEPDAVAVVVDRAEVTEPPPCVHVQDVVVLWHKDSDVAGRAAVEMGLEKRCRRVKEQFTGDRNEAMEWARDLGLPLLAVKAVVAPVKDGALLSHQLSLTVDLVDAQAEGLKVLVHARDTRNVLQARDDVDAWAKAAPALVGAVLDRALTRLDNGPPPP